MRLAAEIVVAALAGLRSRWLRTALLALGPLLGVAAMVGVTGLSESAKGDLQAALRALGTDLLVVEPGAQVVDEGSVTTLPQDAVKRALTIPTVEGVAGTTLLAGLAVSASREDASVRTAGIQVQAADASLTEVLDIGLAHGRFLNELDDAAGLPSVVVGSEVGRRLAILAGQPRTVVLGARTFGVVGVLEPVVLAPALDRGVFVSYTSASSLLGHDASRPTHLFVRAQEGQTRTTSDYLPTAVTYGVGGAPLIRVPTDLLEAEAEIDRTLRAVALAMGGLALFIGAFGIANVLTMAVIQRSTEIGIRRALGHTRAMVGLQFLLEATIVGLVGALLGGIVGTAIVVASATRLGWTMVLDPLLLVATVLTAVVVTSVAGVYPATRAARLEPLEILRLA